MNTVINVYDTDFNLIGVIDDFSSIIWRPAYYDVGDFEIYTVANTKTIDLLRQNRLVVRNTDISVDSDGNITCKNVMIIKNIQIKTDVENGNYLIVTGRELKFILHQRIVWTQTNLSGRVHTAIGKLVTENAINPSEDGGNRVIPNLVLGAFFPTLYNIEKQITGDFLDEAITEICASYNFGWEICVKNGVFTFNIYNGLDRSYSQSVRPYVVFSDEFENLYNTDYQLITEEYANIALIGGEGEGTDRTYTTVDTEGAAGLDRYEMFVDARDLSSNKDSEDEIPLSQYLEILQERGIEQLAEKSITEGFSGEILNNSGNSFKYGVDFNLGDTVTVINAYGIKRDVKVLSAIESEDENGITLIPQFNF